MAEALACPILAGASRLWLGRWARVAWSLTPGADRVAATADPVSAEPLESKQVRRSEMIPDHYVWLVWSSAFLLPWLVAYLAFPRQRNAMLWASLFTMPLGLTEPLFVPRYWNPPSLFDLAQRTGFDIESLIF